MAGPRYLTNRTLITKGSSSNPNDKPVLRKFQLICEYKGFYWVKAINGNLTAEMLTFPKSQLFDFEESSASLQAHFK